jgi:DDE superfamily endonuclease
MAALTTLYRPAPVLGAAGERGLSTDDMTGIQALERPPPPRLREPGQAARRACAYRRRGPMTLSAPCDGAPGTGVTPSRGPTRTEEDFVRHIARTIASAPEVTRWPLVADNRNMHQSASVVRLVADHDKIPDDLGPQGTRGIRCSRRTRAAFLADPTHRSVCHAPPQQASWRNPMELWCSMLVRKLLKRARCTAVEALQARGLAGVEDFHTTMAKPFQWTYGQKPLHVERMCYFCPAVLAVLPPDIWERTPSEAQAYIRALEARVAALEGMM